MKEEITKELLEDLYYRQGLSGKRIAQQLNISKNSWLRLKEQFKLNKSIEQVQQDAKKWQIKSTPTEKELIDFYLKENYTITDVCNKFNIGRTKVHRLFKKYKIKKEIEEVVKTREKTCLQKYGTKQASASSEVRQKISNAYSDGSLMKNIIDIKKQNGTLNFSKPEEEIYQLLLTKFDKDDIKRQYSTQVYKWPCDFYIESLDLYIEYQGTWVHGKEPYDGTNLIHKKLADIWKIKNTEYFNYAFKIWTKRDPLKREIAKENKLNWLEFWSIEEIKAWLQSI